MSLKNEILRAKAELAAAKKEREEIEIRAEQTLIMLREILDPYGEFVDMELDKASLLMSDFKQHQERARELDERIRKIGRDIT